MTPKQDKVPHSSAILSCDDVVFDGRIVAGTFSGIVKKQCGDYVGAATRPRRWQWAYMIEEGVIMTNRPALNLSIGGGAQAPRIFDLEQPRTDTMPIHPSHRPGYSYVLHRRHQDALGQDGPRSSASGMIVCMEH